MKKIILAAVFALIGAFTVMAAEEVYTFKASVTYPAMKGAYRDYAKSALTGTLTVDAENTNSTAVLVATLKGTKEVFTFDLDDDALAIVLGKKSNVAGSLVTFAGTSDAGSEMTLTCAGKGALKYKTTKSGCGPCGDYTEDTCVHVKNISGYCVGTYKCPCDNPQFSEYDGTCDGIEDTIDNVAPVWGTWSVALKTVNGAKW